MSDLIAVRPDEGFDIGRLRKWLDTQDDLPQHPFTVSQFGGGKANLTYLLTFANGAELVLRRPPLGPLAEGSHDMSREYRVLSRLWQAFPRAPRAVAICKDPDVIGAPFLLMERLGGIVVRGTIPESFGGGREPATNQRLSEVVVDTLAEFHAVEASAVGLDELGRPDGFLLRQVEGWTRRWEAARHEPNPVADELVRWLLDKLPVSPPPRLLHNDWRLDNMALAVDDPGRCVAVYDWDMATRGDPLVDLGTLMGSWLDPGENRGRLAMMPTTAPGWLSRDQAVNRYLERTGMGHAPVEWYLVFGAWKLAIILQQIYIRWHRGQTLDERFEEMGVAARDLFDLAAARRKNGN